MTNPPNNSGCDMKIVFGAMTIGKPGVEMSRVHTIDETAAILDVFQAHGHQEVDTARVYGEGSSEEYLGQLKWQDRGLIMETKLYPTRVAPGTINKELEPYSHTAEGLRTGLLASLKALKTDKIDMWYLHGPDRKVSFEETLQEVDRLYREGRFNRFGISNYQSWEVARMCELCERNSWIKPSVYQGLYNVWHRAVEAELFNCLRHYGIAMYCFNPLAGGFLTDRYGRSNHSTPSEKARDSTGSTASVPEGSRFDPKRWQGKLARSRYFDELYFDALDTLRSVLPSYTGLTESECALRWLVHHSQMSVRHGDAIIVGASSKHHLEDNLAALEKGPLPDEVIAALDAGWQRIRGKELKFWH